jgi:CrcB protein
MTAVVAIAGGMGAVARYALDGWLQQRTDRVFPIGTFAVNVTGSFALGILVGLSIAHGLDPDAKLVAGTGFLGGYTTFSTYAYETFRLAEDGSRRLAALNAMGSIAAGLGAATLGLLATGGL